MSETSDNIFLKQEIILIKILSLLYSVMQSDGNRFCGDVVLDSFSMSYRDQDSILDQKYEMQISLDPYYEDFKYQKGLR